MIVVYHVPNTDPVDANGLLEDIDVSSERTFSSARITISKHRNHLKADIVEPLQCLKFMLKWGLLFHEDLSVIVEVGEDSEKNQKGGTLGKCLGLYSVL
jgi:hypothetical protein